jgi:hypothetical protein
VSRNTIFDEEYVRCATANTRTLLHGRSGGMHSRGRLIPASTEAYDHTREGVTWVRP